MHYYNLQKTKKIYTYILDITSNFGKLDKTKFL
jgi:hypothetical protein